MVFFLDLLKVREKHAPSSQNPSAERGTRVNSVSSLNFQHFSDLLHQVALAGVLLTCFAAYLLSL